MDLTSIFKFIMDDSMFTFAVVLVSFVLGWGLYRYVVLRSINLKDSLFEKDNAAAWFEFIGAFIFPTLYLAAKAIEDSASDNIFCDLLYCLLYAVIYIVIFTILRLLTGAFVKSVKLTDEGGKVSLNNEIYVQKNISAALYSITFSLIFVSIIKFLDFSSDFTTSLLKLSSILVFTLVAFIAYCLIIRKKTSLMKEIFIDNNIAAGADFLGYIFAVELMLGSAVSLQVDFNFPELLTVSAISLALFGIFTVVFKIIFSLIVKVKLWKEVYEQNNLGAAIGQCALYIGIANIIISFMK
ncbi:MAG: DUF350 domain-containing protein [Bacillota bacterium]|nr:DUF350 domain-containing protein [Bacillota bacterium]